MKDSKFARDFDSLSNYLKRFALKLTKDVDFADDLFQETALNAFRHKDKYRENTNMKAWLSTIMKNSFINHFRKKKRWNLIQDTSADQYTLNHTQTVANDGEMNIAVDEIYSIINSLSEEYKVPFLMAYNGYRYHEIQERLKDIPLGTVKSRIHHARRILKRKMAERYTTVELASLVYQN
ncbi:MAG: RNA polymerase sigma factor [Bacteroidota bacterium]